jgi:hypothetical protein
MDEESQDDQIKNVIERLLGPGDELAVRRRVLDVFKPNIHDTKKEFLKEQASVSAVVEHLKGVLSSSKLDEKNPKHDDTVARLSSVVDQIGLKQSRKGSVTSARDLTVQNVAVSGFYYTSLSVVLEMLVVYSQLLRELEVQEKQFWNVSNRPPNYYPRTMALRLARLYASETGSKPTFGMSRDGNYPSTKFGRALEDIFAILGIKASVKNAAHWAIAQLEDSDLDTSRRDRSQEIIGIVNYLKVTHADGGESIRSRVKRYRTERKKPES